MLYNFFSGNTGNGIWETMFWLQTITRLLLLTHSMVLDGVMAK